MVSSYYLLLSGKPHIIIFLLFFIARALILINDDENKLWHILLPLSFGRSLIIKEVINKNRAPTINNITLAIDREIYL